MENGTVYNSTIIQTQTFVNLTLSQEALTDLENSLSSDIFSIGLDANFSLAGKELWIASRDANSAARRPKLTIIHSYESNDLTWNENGYLTEGFGFKLTYDSFNHLSEVNNSANQLIEDYIYDHEGNRIRKREYNIDTQGNNRTTYYLWPEFVHVRITNGTILNFTYYYANGKLLSMKDNDGNKFYYHPDHLGSTTLVTNQSGDVVNEIFYF